MASDPLTVQLFWTRSGAGGQLLLRRHMPFDEFWASGQLDESDLAGRDPATLDDRAWRPLLQGLRVDEVRLGAGPLVVGLRRTTKPAAHGALLLDASVWWTDDNGRLVTDEVGLRAAERELLARLFRPGITQALRGLNQELVLETRERRAADHVLADFREMRSGPGGGHNVPMYRFLSDGLLARPEGKVLRGPGVEAVVNNLLNRPEDIDRAEAVLSRLKALDPDVRSRPILLAPGPGAEVVSRIVVIGGQGVQIGHKPLQVNVFLCTHDEEIAERVREDKEFGPWVAKWATDHGEAASRPAALDELRLRDRIGGELRAFRVEVNRDDSDVTEIPVRPGRETRPDRAHRSSRDLESHRASRDDDAANARRRTDELGRTDDDEAIGGERRWSRDYERDVRGRDDDSGRSSSRG
jgi:hypothetical protein